MHDNIGRRAALKPMAALTFFIASPALLLGCGKKPDCNDVSKLSDADLHVRNDVAQYADQSMDATKHCSACVQFVAAAPEQCGGCKVVKGPINPNGNCTLFVLKQS